MLGGLGSCLPALPWAGAPLVVTWDPAVSSDPGSQPTGTPCPRPLHTELRVSGGRGERLPPSDSVGRDSFSRRVWSPALLGPALGAWRGVNGVLPKRQVHPDTVTLFGKSVFADVINGLR